MSRRAKTRADETSRNVGVRELKNRASAIVSEVREQAAEYVVTVHGEPVAVLRPYGDEDRRRERRRRALATLARMDALAERISAGWRSDLGAVEAVAAERR